MRSAPILKLERYRVRDPFGIPATELGNNGWFLIPQKNGPDLKVICSDGGGWDHVSVSTETRCPTWEEMEFVRSIVFRDDETVMQLSVPRSRHINHHPYCLHMWRPQAAEIPAPPAYMVSIV